VKNVSISNSKCELCGTQFKFKKKYLNGEVAPHLGIIEILYEILPLITNFIQKIWFTTVFAFLWLFSLPVATYFISNCLSILLDLSKVDKLKEIINTDLFLSPMYLTSIWLQGVYILIFILIFTLVFYQVFTLIIEVSYYTALFACADR
jgi:hypothetical protein